MKDASKLPEAEGEKPKTKVSSIHIAAELAPIAKVGGLGDVLHGLCRAFLKKEHSVTVILPKYDLLDLHQVKLLAKMDEVLSIFFDGAWHTNHLWKGFVDEIPVIFIEPHAPQKFFSRNTIYGCHDDIARFCYFCLAALEYAQRLSCDVIHLHDWHTALIAGLIKELYPHKETKVVLTIHNLSYQGLCREEDLDKVGWKSAKFKEGELYNLLKGGIVFADHVTTVSPNYAQELLTSDLGGKLQATLQQHVSKFSGVLNGIDSSYWDPQTDLFLPYHYSQKDLSNKLKIKQRVQRHFGLKEENLPLVCCITRIVHQKGPELIKAALLRTLEWGGQFILLGSLAEEHLNSAFLNLKYSLSGSPYVHLELTFDEALSHLLFAASDLIVIPSLFEPCGLTQMVAMRYGTVPLVRKTGGLADTVSEVHSGFLFESPTVEALHGALDRAFETWFQRPDLWNQLIENGMKGNWSWDASAAEYLKLYNLP